MDRNDGLGPSIGLTSYDGEVLDEIRLLEIPQEEFTSAIQYPQRVFFDPITENLKFQNESILRVYSQYKLPEIISFLSHLKVFLLL